jgi:hypothetical protein
MVALPSSLAETKPKYSKNATAHLIVKFNHTADSIALIAVDIILYGIGFVCFNEFI